MGGESGIRTEDARVVRDVLVVGKVMGSSEFPVERPAVIGVDRETGALTRLSPYPWKGTDTDPPVPKWAWLSTATRASEYDPRPESREVVGEVALTAYVEPRDGWRLRWPFVRPHVVASVAEVQQRARDGIATAAFVRPAPDADVLQLPLRLRFRCADGACADTHELPVLDWELLEMARATRERYGPQWATRFRETWGTALFERYDVHILVSTYAQAPTRPYVAGLFYPPKQGEDPHEHAHHVEHRQHG